MTRFYIKKQNVVFHNSISIDVVFPYSERVCRLLRRALLRAEFDVLLTFPKTSDFDDGYFYFSDFTVCNSTDISCSKIPDDKLVICVKFFTCEDTRRE